MSQAARCRCQKPTRLDRNRPRRWLPSPPSRRSNRQPCRPNRPKRHRLPPRRRPSARPSLRQRPRFSQPRKCRRCRGWIEIHDVIPGATKSASFDVQLHIRESITTIVSMDSGPAPCGASRNDQEREEAPMTKLTPQAAGTFAIAPTPFHDDGRIDEKSIDRLTDFYAEVGCEGVTVLGILGEAPKLDAAEAEQVAIRFVKRAKTMQIIVGVSAPGFATMRSLAKASMDA